VKPLYRRWLPPLLWAAGIFALSARSRLPTLPPLLDWDKGQHALAYALGGVLLARALRPRRHAWLLALALGSLYGVSDEIHQSFVRGRQADPLDWVADTLGVLAGIALFHFLAHRRARSAGPAPARHAQPVSP
jgi:VanZ family protein